MRKGGGGAKGKKAVQSFPLYLKTAPQISSINNPFLTHSQYGLGEINITHHFFLD